MKLIVMIPAYNEEQSIGKVIKEIPRKIPGIKKVEVLVINDGSTDRTVNEARKAGAEHIITNSSNRGVGYSFRHGIDLALDKKANIIVNIDGDGQFNPDDIPTLIQPLLDHNADMVTCTRFKGPHRIRDMPFVKDLGNRIFTWLISFLVGQKFSDTQCGFRAYTQETALKLNIFGDFTYTQEVFIDLAFKHVRIKEISLPVRTVREFGKSKVVKGVIPYTARALKIIIRSFRDYKPLTFFGIPGLFIFGIGTIFGIYVFGYWLFTSQTSPVRTNLIISTITLILGTLLIILALLADMLDRIRMNQERLLFHIKGHP